MLSLAEDNDFGYEHQVAVTADPSDSRKIGHVKKGFQEVFVKECLSDIALRVTAICVTASARDFKSSKIYGFEMKITVECTGAVDLDHFRACYQQFVSDYHAESAKKETEAKKKVKPSKSAATTVKKIRK